MRSKFRGHFGEPIEEVDRLWQQGTFVFDANVLLNLYRYSDKARQEFLSLLEKIQERSWLPEQCVHEYLTNRLTVIRAQMKAYSTTEKSIQEIQGTFAGSKGHPFVSDKNFAELKNTLEKISRELKRNANTQEERLTKDDAKEKIADIFDGRVGNPYSSEELDKLFDQGKIRYDEEFPPGYKDGTKHPNATKRTDKRSNFGDFILWQQTMDFAKSESKDVIFITDDQKEDWWLISSGKTVSARPELIEEFYSTTEKRVLFYNPDTFLKVAQEKLGLKVSDKTIAEIRDEHDSRSQDISKRRKLIEQEAERFSASLNMLNRDLNMLDPDNSTNRLTSHRTRDEKYLGSIRPSTYRKKELLARRDRLRAELASVRGRLMELEEIQKAAQKRGSHSPDIIGEIQRLHAQELALIYDLSGLDSAE